ncbi:MAG: ABC transporter permease [Anaerolineales bacterium]|jgi:ABC-2 type transport system permease protein
MKAGSTAANLRVILAAFEMTLKQAATDAFILFGVLVQPLMIAIMGLYVLGAKGEDIAIFIVVGSGLTGLWDGVLFQSGNSITAERWTGTLEILVGMPTPLAVVTFGKNLAYVTQSLLSMLASYFLASLLFGYPLSIKSPVAFSVSVLLTVLSFVSLGLLMSTLFVLNPDVQRWQNGLEYPIFILSGFLFPIALLPFWTTPLSYILAPFWAAQALHTSSQSIVGFQDLLLDWGMLCLLGVVYAALAGVLFRRVLYKARSDATLIGQ